MNSVISLKNIEKIFPDSPGKPLVVLKNINLEIFQGEFFLILGPSGSGKSTLLRIMSGLEKSFTGRIELDPGLKQKDISFVFQQFAIFPWLNVFENIEFALISFKIPEKKRREMVLKQLKKFGLEEFSNAYPKQLSGGMRQRVGLARAFVKEPKIIFMDEPFSELDSFTTEELHKELLQIWAEKKPTVIMVTHLIEEAVKLGDRIAVLTQIPGRIEKIVENKLPRPRNNRTSEFYNLEDELYSLVRT